MMTLLASAYLCSVLIGEPGMSAPMMEKQYRVFEPRTRKERIELLKYDCKPISGIYI